MSFSKAKLNRYYDELTCAPPPGKYDPKLDSKVKGVVFDKGQRFGTPKMDRSSSVESLDSCCSSKTPIFRTPSKILSKKGPTTTPRIRDIGSRIPLPNKFNPSQISDNDQRLIDEINELTRVHQNQLLEKNEEIATLIDQINTLNDKISNIRTTHVTPENKLTYEAEISKLKNELLQLQSSITVNSENYKNQVDDLQSHITNLEENISNHVSINKELECSFNENSLVYEEINTRITKMADEFTVQLNTFVESINKVEDLNRCLFEDYQYVLELLKKESEENILNKQMLMELQESINVCKDDLTNALKRCKMYEVVQTETSKTINVLSKRLMESEIEVDHLNDVQQDLVVKKNRLEEQVKGLSEENQVIRNSLDALQVSVKLDVETMQNQLLEKVQTYRQFAVEESEKQKACIEEKQKTIDMLLGEIVFYKNKKTEADLHFSSCQAKISDYQEELSHLKTVLTDLENDFQEKIGAQKALFSELSSEYETLKNHSVKEKQQLKKRVLQLSKDKTTLESACSDKETKITNLETNMEQMNHQLSQNEKKIEHLESLTIDYDSEISKITLQLEEKTKMVVNLEKVNSKILIDNTELKTDNKTLLESLDRKEEAYNKLEEKYKVETESFSELKKDLKTIEFNNQAYDEIVAENVEVKKKLSTQEEIIQLFEYERIAHTYSFEEYLEQKDELLKIIERQNREIEALSETADKHYSAKRDFEQEITKLNEEKEQLKDAGKEDSMKVTCLEARIADLECRNRELTDIIGPFKDQLMQFETERNFLVSKSENTEKELRALALEHAKSLGHQNHKQKIKHVVNLNQTIANLKKEIEKYRLENIKLKHELTSKKPSSLASAKKNKENKSNSQQKERNTSPATALKDRNG